MKVTEVSSAELHGTRRILGPGVAALGLCAILTARVGLLAAALALLIGLPLAYVGLNLVAMSLRWRRNRLARLAGALLIADATISGQAGRAKIFRDRIEFTSRGNTTTIEADESAEARVTGGSFALRFTRVMLEQSSSDPLRITITAPVSEVVGALCLVGSPSPGRTQNTGYDYGDSGGPRL